MVQLDGGYMKLVGWSTTDRRRVVAVTRFTRATHARVGLASASPFAFVKSVTVSCQTYIILVDMETKNGMESSRVYDVSFASFSAG